MEVQGGEWRSWHSNFGMCWDAWWKLSPHQQPDETKKVKDNRTSPSIRRSSASWPALPSTPSSVLIHLFIVPPEISPISQGIVAPRRDCKAFWNDSQDKQKSCRKESAKMILSGSARCTSAGEGVWVEGPGLELTLELLPSGLFGSPCAWHSHSPILY